MVKVTVRSDQILTYKGINYYGGQSLEVPNSILESIHSKVHSPLHNLKPITKKTSTRTKNKPKKEEE